MKSPLSFLKDLDKSERELQIALKQTFKVEFMYDFKISLVSILTKRFDALRYDRKRPILGKDFNFKRNHLVERNGKIIHSFDDLWLTFIDKIQNSPELVLFEKALLSLAKDACKDIYSSKDSYITRHGILMSSPLSFPTLNFVNILGRDISRVKLQQYFYGDDELTIGYKAEIEKFLSTMKKMGLIYSDEKDVMSRSGGIFVEIPFHVSDHRITVVPAIKSKIYCPTDATYLDAFSTLKHSHSSSNILNARAFMELELKFHKQIKYLSDRGVPLDLIPPLGGLNVENPPYNDNVLWYLERIPRIFECQPSETINYLFELKRITHRSSRFAQRCEISRLVSGQLQAVPTFRVNYEGKGFPLMTTIENLSNQLYASQLFLSEFSRTYELTPHYKYLASQLIGFVGKLTKTQPRSSLELEKEYDSFRRNTCFTVNDTAMAAIESVTSRKLASNFFT